VLEVRASKRSAESKYAQIVRLVEEAQAHKAPIRRLADRYAVWFTIAAIALAGLSWAISKDSVYALAVLVVATPCPLILATPIAIMSGIDLAAHNGIIAKSGAAIEQLGEVDIAVFDKTGTLTLGIPKVTAILLPEPENQNPVGTELSPSTSHIPSSSLTPNSGSATPGSNGTPTTAYDKNTLLSFAASVEQLSTHILARAVVDASLERDLTLRAFP
jgi:P-type E1-E2 ATPase